MEEQARKPNPEHIRIDQAMRIIESNWRRSMAAMGMELDTRRVQDLIDENVVLPILVMYGRELLATALGKPHLAGVIPGDGGEEGDL